MTENIINSKYDEVYFGSRSFMFISNLSGLPIDQVNFVIAQLAAVLIAWFFRVFLHPSHTSPDARHKVAFLSGFSLAYFCFGKQVIFALGMLLICYLLLLLAPVTMFHKITMVASIGFLSMVHLQRQFLQDGLFVLDITSALMIMVQRATSLAFSLHDGLVKKEEELTTLQKQALIRKKPSALEYFSYMMSFQSILAGPFVLYADYQDFIHGNQYLKYTIQPRDNNNSQASLNESKEIEEKTEKSEFKEPNPTAIALWKIVVGFLFAIVTAVLAPKYSVDFVTEPAFFALSFVNKMAYIVISTTLARGLYYTGWLLADAICNMSGLGFNGYDQNGRERWDKVSNVDIYNVEFGQSMKTILDAWNINTMLWLRLTVYERVKSYPILAVFTMSSIWHGFYPGYYFTFIMGIVLTYSSRQVRRALRPRVIALNQPIVKGLYDFGGFFMSHLYLAYVSFSFVLLKFTPAINVYRSLYFSLHILGIVVPLLTMMLPKIKAKSNPSSTTTLEQKKVQ